MVEFEKKVLEKLVEEHDLVLMQVVIDHTQLSDRTHVKKPAYK